MTKILLLSVSILLFVLMGTAQPFSLKGKVTDATSKQTMKNTVISLLQAKDSILVSFSRTKEGGSFDMQKVPAGKYVLLISHPDFADYADIIEVKSDMDLGNIDMLSKAVVLQNVIVRGSPIRMKGDTLAYVADSFKVREGATVEDLLKKLPGIQVNSKGEITAQGERVQKVLVDGEEFFGDDPTLATQNMIAKAVKEVQVFDKKSEQADFTGVDDGQKTKTINLKLKDEFKKGYFGKVDLAGGLPDRWANSGMINFFKDKRKFSVYGKMSNTGDNGLGWREENQYGGGIGMQTEINEDGGINISSSGDEFGGIGSYNGEGIPKGWMGGGSYSNKWNQDKNTVNGAYRFQKLNTEGTTTTNTQTILPDTQYFNNEVAKTQASRWRQRANLKSDINIDSSQSLVVTADGSYGESRSAGSLLSEALTATKQPVNRNERISSTNATTGTFNSGLLYKKKFKKKSRTFSLQLSEKYKMNNSDGYLKSLLELYQGGAYLRTDTIDQKKINHTHSLSLDSRASYTEPVGKGGIVEISYGYSINNSEQERLSYDHENGKYDTLNSLYSNDYQFNTGTHKGGLGYRYNRKKITFGFGSDATLSKWKQTNLFTNVVRNYNFNNFFPRANFSYKLGQYSRVGFEYKGYTRAPGIDQLQPVANNDDPLNIAIGNPNLKQSFNHNLSLNYNFYQVLKEQGMWLNIYYNPTNHDFSTLDRVDTLGRRIYQTVNVDGNYNLGGYIGYNFKWKKPDLNINININPQINRISNFVNGLKNENINKTIGLGFDISKYKDKKYDISIGSELNYNYTSSSIRPDVVTKYWTAMPRLNLGVDLPLSIHAGTDFNYNWRQKTDVFSNNNTFIWNADITKKLWKKQDVRLGFKVHDILNQNLGFSRDASTNYITEKTYNVIRRYWMATLTYNFNKGPKKEEEW